MDDDGVTMRRRRRRREKRGQYVYECVFMCVLYSMYDIKTLCGVNETKGVKM